MTISCPECQSRSNRVLDSRERGDGTRRRRECTNGHRYTTFEVVVPSNTQKYTVQVIVHRIIQKREVYSSMTIGGDNTKLTSQNKTEIKSVDDLNDRQKASLAKLKQEILERKNKGG